MNYEPRSKQHSSMSKNEPNFRHLFIHSAVLRMPSTLQDSQNAELQNSAQQPFYSQDFSRLPLLETVAQPQEVPMRGTKQLESTLQLMKRSRPTFSDTEPDKESDESSGESDEESDVGEDPKDSDFRGPGEGKLRVGGGAPDSVRKSIYDNHPKKRVLSRTGSFEVPCTEPGCKLGGWVHVNRRGKQAGYLENHGKGAKRRKIEKRPPACHQGEFNAALLLGAFEELAGEIQRSSSDNSEKAMFAPGTSDFNKMKKQIEWGKLSEYGPGHIECNAKHGRGDFSYTKVSESKKKAARQEVKTRLKEAMQQPSSTLDSSFWKGVSNLYKTGTTWGPNHPLGQNPFQPPKGGGGGGTTA